jgi:general secretion pathway protein I
MKCAQTQTQTQGKSAAQAGFSLLEVLVAFSIMAVSVSMLYQVIGGTTQSISHVEQSQRAVMLAESLLASNDTVGEDGWNESGESAGYGWQAQSVKYPTPISEEFPTAAPLHEVMITVAWRDGLKTRQIVLKTLRAERKTVGVPGAK